MVSDARSSTEVQWAFVLLLLVFAMHINHYHWQLMVYNASDDRDMAAKKRLREETLAKDLCHGHPYCFICDALDVQIPLGESQCLESGNFQHSTPFFCFHFRRDKAKQKVRAR
jgi:hypothetical protein